ncbi:replicative DNA helicase [Pasteurella multocida]|nr:replicative DNA helicase [Pasteurella multocida]
MIHPAHWDSISDMLIADDFYLAAHRVIFQEMENLLRQGKPIDLINLYEFLREKNLSEDVGGFAYLAELSKNTPSVSNIVSYAAIVRDRAILRDLISVSNDVAQSCYTTKGMEVKDILDEAERKVFAISEKRTTSNEGPQNICAILEKTIDRIELLSKTEGHNGITGVSTGFDALDKKTAGLQPSDLIIVAARPSMGKTTFAMNLCENAALKSDKPVFSL